METTEYELDGIVTLPSGTNADDFFDKFIGFIESQNATFGGSLGIYNEDKADGDLAVERLNSGNKRYSLEEVEKELGLK